MPIIVSDEFGERKIAGEEIPNTQIQVADHKKFPDRYQPTGEDQGKLELGRQEKEMHKWYKEIGRASWRERV